MGAVIATPELISLLSSLKQPTEIRDGQGQVLGFFTPQAVAEDNRLRSLFDIEEAERVLATQGDAGRPLQEILRDIRGQGPHEIHGALASSGRGSAGEPLVAGFGPANGRGCFWSAGCCLGK